uniref:G3BP-like protein n=1 Tax=Angiostrongylus cantonensis TaxID=6313 RepID=A0A158P5S8_ANGCA
MVSVLFSSRRLECFLLVSKDRVIVIGLEFVRQYYTILSKQPGNVHKFYSHESVFVHNDVTVVGQQKIKNCIEQLVEANNRFKIHSVKGSFTSNKGIVLQVCGEVSTRRFFQTFILAQQSAKKFYVQNDIFQFVDVAFHCESQDSPAPPASSESAVAESPPVENTLKSKVEQTNLETTMPLPADNTPKTWAHRVGGGPKSGAAPSATLSGQKSSYYYVYLNTHLFSWSSISHGERRIYLGGIIRNIVPDNTNIAEQEIKDAFSKFGEVESVAIPRKVLDQPNDASRNGFAFISMRTAVDAQNVFQKARKDDRGTYHLQLRLDAFGFDGEVTISEQKDRVDRPSGGFRGNRSGFISRGGASSFSRSGGRGRGGGGGFRGGFHNQGNH